MAKPPSTPANPADDNFRREVDDAVRQSDVQDFFRRYGWWLVGLVIVVLIAWGGYIYWQNRQDDEAGKLAESYIQSLDKVKGGVEGKGGEEALTGFAMLAEQGTPGYRASGKLMQANILAGRGEKSQALDLYGQVAADDDVAKPFRDLALIRGVLLEYDDLKPRQIIERLEPLAQPGEAFFGTAAELVALAHMQLNETDEAGKIFTELARDEDVPGEIRARAQLMANQIGIDLDVAAEKEAAGIQRGESGSE